VQSIAQHGLTSDKPQLSEPKSDGSSSIRLNHYRSTLAQLKLVAGERMDRVVGAVASEADDGAGVAEESFRVIGSQDARRARATLHGMAKSGVLTLETRSSWECRLSMIAVAGGK
jgi:hypothetical protein